MDKKPELKKPEFVKIKDMFPVKHCYHVYGKVIKSTTSETTRISGDKVQVVDGVIGDETGVVNFHFEGPNCQLVPVGAVVAIRNGRAEVVDEHLRLEVDKFGKITTEDASKVKTVDDKNNLSAVSYEKRPSGRRN